MGEFDPIVPRAGDTDLLICDRLHVIVTHLDASYAAATPGARRVGFHSSGWFPQWNSTLTLIYSGMLTLTSSYYPISLPLSRFQRQLQATLHAQGFLSFESIPTSCKRKT